MHLVIIAATVFLSAAFPVGALAQDPAAPAKEEPVDLNSLEEAVDLNALEEPGSGPNKSGSADEPLLPVAVGNVELERHPWLMLAALIVLAPIAAMLFPPKRKQSKQPAAPNRGQSNDREEN